FLGANGMPEKMSIVQGVGAITGVILYLILIPVYDIVGAAIGSSVAYLVSSLAAFYFFYRIVPFGSVNMFRITLQDLRWVINRSMSSIGFLQKIWYRITGQKPPKKENKAQQDDEASIPFE
ncbi:MAG: polysaccharide biosynthesis C-terminal domain-containing protein, partial [Bacteroidota bacterium]